MLRTQGNSNVYISHEGQYQRSAPFAVHVDRRCRSQFRGPVRQNAALFHWWASINLHDRYSHWQSNDYCNGLFHPNTSALRLSVVPSSALLGERPACWHSSCWHTPDRKGARERVARQTVLSLFPQGGLWCDLPLMRASRRPVSKKTMVFMTVCCVPIDSH